MQNKTEILNEIKQAVLSVDENAEVVLFGSRARGDYNEESDWDVLVLTNRDVNNVLRLQIIDVLIDIELKYSIGISSIIRNNDQWETLKSSDLYKNVKEDAAHV